MIQILKIESKAPNTSALWYPQLYLPVAFLVAMIKPTIEKPIPMTSESKWAASDMIAIEFAK